MAPHPDRKVFCIGLSRTGTTSLDQALQLLGYRTAHFPRHLVSFDGPRPVRAAAQAATLLSNLVDPRRRGPRDRIYDGGSLRLRADGLDHLDSVGDTVAARFYRQLDRAYPGARFILTVRDLEGWLASCERFFCEGRLRGDHVLNKLRLDLYGATCFERTRFADAYARHVDGVQAYFGDRPDDLLVLDVVGGDGWGPLCRFLSHDRPDAPFPRARSRERAPDLTLSGALARHARTDPLRHAARTVARLLGA